MYRVYLHIKNSYGEPQVQITFSSEHSFSSSFYKFVYQSCDIICPHYWIDDGYSDEVFDAFFYGRDLNVGALIDFLNFIYHCSTIFYNSNFDLTALYNFEQDLEKILSHLPF